QVPEVPRRQVAVLPQDVERFRLGGARHAPAFPRSRSGRRRSTSPSQSATSRRVKGLRISVQGWRSSQVRTSSASASPVMIAIRPSSEGQRWTMARYSASPDMVGSWMSSSTASAGSEASRSYAVSALAAPITRKPNWPSERSSTRRSDGSSSTTRSVGRGGRGGGSGAGGGGGGRGPRAARRRWRAARVTHGDREAKSRQARDMYDGS